MVLVRKEGRDDFYSQMLDIEARLEIEKELRKVPIKVTKEEME